MQRPFYLLLPDSNIRLATKQRLDSMINKSFLFLLLSFIFNNHVAAQTSKKEYRNHRQEIFKLDTNEIRNGQHLSFAETFTIEKFLAYYLENGIERDTKMYREVITGKLYRDNRYTYFGSRYSYGLIDFFKVENAALDGLPYEELDGEAIRQQFIEEIVPSADKKMVARREKNNTSLYYNPSFNYLYSAHSGDIEITYKWRVYGDFGIKVINKTYKAKYDIATKQFKPTNMAAYNQRRGKKS